MTVESNEARPDLTGQSSFWRNIAFAWGGYFINVITGFIIPRLLSDHLGQTTLGIWDFSWSIVSYFVLLQMGISGSVDRYVARYRAQSDFGSLNRSVSTVARFLSFSGWAAVLITGITVWWVLPMFQHQLDGALDDCRWVVTFLGLEIAFCTMLTVYGAVIVGCHRWDVHNSISAIGYALTAIGMVAALLFGGNLPWLAAIHCVVAVGGDIVRRFLCRRICPELIVDYKKATWSVIAEQTRYSIKSLIPRVGELISNQASNIMITMHLGPASLAIFSRPKSLMRTLQTLAAKFGYILIPTASALQAQGGRDELKAVFLKAPATIAALVLPAIITFAVFGDQVVRIWMGAHYVCDGLVSILAIGAFPVLVHEPVWGILAGMNSHGKLAKAKLAAACASIALLTLGLGVFQWTLWGAAACFTLPQVFVDGIVTPVIACRRMKVSLGGYYFTTFLKPFLCATPFAASMVIARWFTNSTVGMVTVSILGTCCSLLLYWRFLFRIKTDESRLPDATCL